MFFVPNPLNNIIIHPYSQIHKNLLLFISLLLILLPLNNINILIKVSIIILVESGYLGK